MTTSRADVIEDYQQVAQELDKRPTLDEYNEHGTHSSTLVYKHFESFTALKEAAGFNGDEYKIDSSTLLDDLRRVADEIGRSPPVLVYDEHGQHNSKTLKHRFGNWNEVLQEAGLPPTDHSEHWSDVDTVAYSKNYGNSERECEVCGDTVTRREHDFERFESVYCSQACKGKAMSQRSGEETPAWDGGKVAVECEQCGDVNHVRPAKVDRTRFCSQDCMLEWRSDYFTGENHPRWKDNPEYRYYGPNWEEQAAKCRERDDHECQICGRTNEANREIWDEDLTAHHIIRFYDFESYEVANQLPNLVATCKECHGKLESGRMPLPEPHNSRFSAWVEETEKTVADATGRI